MATLILIAKIIGFIGVWFAGLFLRGWMSDKTRDIGRCSHLLGSKRYSGRRTSRNNR